MTYKPSDCPIRKKTSTQLTIGIQSTSALNIILLSQRDYSEMLSLFAMAKICQVDNKQVKIVTSNKIQHIMVNRNSIDIPTKEETGSDLSAIFNFHKMN